MNQETKISQEISLIEIFYELKKKKYVLLLFVIIALIGVSAYKILAPKKYTHQTSFLFNTKNIQNNRSLLGNSSILKNDNLYIDINIPEATSINLFHEISPNSYEDILNSDSALYYFATLPLFQSKTSILDSLKHILDMNTLKAEDNGENPDILLIKKYFNKTTFTSKYDANKNIVYITAVFANKKVSKWLSIISIKYICKYIQQIQNQRIKEQLMNIEKAIANNDILNNSNNTNFDNRQLPMNIQKILDKQLYEYKLQISLLNNTPFNVISTNFMSEKISTSVLFIIAIIVGVIAGGLWIFVQKMWVDSKQNLRK